MEQSAEDHRDAAELAETNAETAQAAAEAAQVLAEAAAASIENGLPKVRVVATSNLDLSAPGASIDSVTLANGETFLATGQTATEENGPYTFNGAAVAATRLASYATFDKIAGQYFSVMEGTVYADTLWRCTSDPGGTLETDPLVFRGGTGGGMTTAANRTALAALTPSAGDVA